VTTGEGKAATSPVFTVVERERVRDHLLERARADPRIVAAATIGSLVRGGDRWSDLDLTFALARDVAPVDVLPDWTQAMARELRAVTLFDLPFRTTIYRVFLLPGNLQVDLSFTPAADFRAFGPKFHLLWGEAGEPLEMAPPSAPYVFGFGVHHLVRARFSIERDRGWQAEYWIRSACDQAFSLACLRHGVEPRYARGWDELPPETKRRFEPGLVRSLDRGELLRALSAAIELLLGESHDARELAAPLEDQLRALVSPDWPADSVGSPAASQP